MIFFETCCKHSKIAMSTQEEVFEFSFDQQATASDEKNIQVSVFQIFFSF